MSDEHTDFPPGPDSIELQTAGSDAADAAHARSTVHATARAIAMSFEHERLLQAIVEAAAKVVGAKLGSLFLVDAESQGLVLDVAYGSTATKVQGLTVPAGHGLVGLVAASGRARAVSDAPHDPRADQAIAERVGYLPRSMVCAPVTHDGQVVGVIELLDKIGAPLFDAADVTLLGTFAALAAVALQHYREPNNGMLSSQMISPAEDDPLVPSLAAARSPLKRDPTYVRSIELAQLVYRIVSLGENEFRACLTILRGFGDYLDSQSKPSNRSG